MKRIRMLSFSLLCLSVLFGVMLYKPSPADMQNVTTNNIAAKPVAATQSVTSTPSAIAGSTPKPKPANVEHVVILVEENHSFGQIIGKNAAPYLNSLVKEGALFSNSFGIRHPSQPNYLALFSGSAQNVKDDSCPHSFSTPNLATELMGAHLSFGGYSEDMPKVGFTGCSSKGYGRKHNPWVNFTNVPAGVNMPLTSLPSDFAKLPTVSFIIPNHMDDMHDGTVAQADQWLKQHIDPYVTWAKKHNSLLIVTWDEDDFSPKNHIPTLFVGPMVKPGTYSETINHYNVLRTIEDMYHLGHLGESAKANPIKDVWK
ncbi:alkaline phosphatase family protein [Brevibacillus fluminis]|nr:alkaline phosphatase family protein [Brevibacillus fluminis]